MRSHSRYDRQIILKELGREGQLRLERSCVAICGVGALGSVSANLLVRAGVGRVKLIDRDFVEVSNLQRQVLFEESDAEENLPKAVAAQRRLSKINSMIRIEAEVADMNAVTVESLLHDVDLIVDGTDNFETRFVLNDFALSRKIPWIYGGAIRTEGMSYVVLPGHPPCLRCLFGEPSQKADKQTCDQVGILAPVAHVIASFQATEAIKILAGQTEFVDRRLWKVDVWNRHFKSMKVEHLQSHPCSGCRAGIYPYLNPDFGIRSMVLCGRNAVQIYESGAREVDFQRVAERLEPLAEVRFNQHLLNIRQDAFEMTLFRSGRAIVKGTEDIGKAKSLYARFVGC